MVQAARSGVQNIAEGSQASGTSRKMELKLTNVARASLEELRLDYEDFLRHRGLAPWPPDHPALKRLKALRCSKLEHVRLRQTAPSGETGPFGPQGPPQTGRYPSLAVREAMYNGHGRLFDSTMRLLGGHWLKCNSFTDSEGSPDRPRVDRR